MPLTSSGKTILLTALDVTHFGLNSAYPGNTGANEISGGSPAYARKAGTLAAESGGARALSASVTGFDVPAGTVVKWITAWTASTAGSCRASAPAGSTKKGVGTLQSSDDIIRSDAHGIVLDERVVFYPMNGEALPTGLVEGTDYFAITITTDTYQVSATQGGAAINLTGDGEFRFQNMVPATDAAQFKFDLTSFDVDLNA